jgi:hypothetical protein
MKTMLTKFYFRNTKKNIQKLEEKMYAKEEM